MNQKLTEGGRGLQWIFGDYTCQHMHFSNHIGGVPVEPSQGCASFGSKQKLVHEVAGADPGGGL